MTLNTNFASLQLYLALYLGLVPINETVQTEIVPVVRAPLLAIYIVCTDLCLAPLLRPHCPRMFPRRSTRIHDPDLQRRSARVRIAPKGD
jgi:hypothetical protein